MIRKALSTLALCLTLATGMAQTQEVSQPAKVYFISDISPESLVKIYQALGNGRQVAKSSADTGIYIVKNANSVKKILKR